MPDSLSDLGFSVPGGEEKQESPVDTRHIPSIAQGSNLSDMGFSLPIGETKPAKEEEQPVSWSDVPSQMWEHLPESAGKFATDIAQPFIHPVETATSLKNVGQGALQKAGILSGTEQIPYADAVGKFFSDRYGGIENFKKTLATDPVGVAADLSAILTGGETALARAPGVVGKVGEIAGTVGRTVDPLTAPLKAAALPFKAAEHVAPEVIGGLLTHTGADPLKIAASAGYEGGEAARALQENIRGVAPMESAVVEARNAINSIRAERGAAYVEAMDKKIRTDPTVLSFDKVDNALADISQVKTFKGIPIDPQTQKIRQAIGETIAEWKMLPADEYHTAEGLDALKQKVGAIRDAIPASEYSSPEMKVATQAYNAIRSTIVEQAPEYAKIMKGYEQASNQIREIEKTLSLNPNASVDTALRKLQSVLRDNVNTSYGYRKELVNYLINAGAPNLMEKLAGQALKSWTPRGLGRLAAGLGAEAGLALLGGHEAGLAGAGMAALTGLPMMSPRLMGEAAYYAGRMASPAKYLPPRRAITAPAYQFGRISNIGQSRGGHIKTTLKLAKKYRRP